MDKSVRIWNYETKWVNISNLHCILDCFFVSQFSWCSKGVPGRSLNCVLLWVVLRRDRDRDILARLRFGHQRPLNRRCPDEKYQYVNNNRLTEYPGSPAWTAADTRDLLVAGVQAGLDTCDLVVAGVRISISPKYLYLYLELSGSTVLFYEDLETRSPI